jgi:hypothetical protein
VSLPEARFLLLVHTPFLQSLKIEQFHAVPEGSALQLLGREIGWKQFPDSDLFNTLLYGHSAAASPNRNCSASRGYGSSIKRPEHIIRPRWTKRITKNVRQPLSGRVKMFG